MTIQAFKAEFGRHRDLAERAIHPLALERLREALDPETNSIAVIVKHVGGNLRSRWTDPFATDGEKPWRVRDREFVDDFADRAALLAAWEAGILPLNYARGINRKMTAGGRQVKKNAGAGHRRRPPSHAWRAYGIRR